MADHTTILAEMDNTPDTAGLSQLILSHQKSTLGNVSFAENFQCVHVQNKNKSVTVNDAFHIQIHFGKSVDVK